MNLTIRLAEMARVSPGQEALVFNNHSLTYAQMEAQVNRLASGLQQMGIKPGDRVLLTLRNSSAFIIAYYAVIRIKGVAVPVNPRYTINELSAIVKDCLPAMVISIPSQKESLAAINKEIKIPGGIIIDGDVTPEEPFITLEQAYDMGTDPLPELQYRRDDLAVILYTNGSTNKPMGVMLTHYNLYSNALTLSELCQMTAADRLLLTAPVYHSAAQTCIMNNGLVSGATIVIQEGWQGAEETLKIMESQKITFFFGPPTMYNLLTNCTNLDKYDTSSLRIALTGAASVMPDLYEEFEARLKLPLTEGYGLTETSPVVTLNFISESGKTGSIGKPIPGVEVKIFDYEDREVPQGQVGEIVVRGPNVMKGYYNQPDETRWVLRNGWLHTGDLAYFDQDGDLYIVDRKKELIIRGGININPREVEEVLYDYPDVFEVAVVGVPDAVMGEEVLAFIMPREGKKINEDEIKLFCQDKMVDYKIPRYYRFVDSLPKTSSGKLLRKEILSWVNKK